MSKSRFSGSQRASRSPAHLAEERVRFLGLSLGGGKADKACLAVLDYYPNHKKIFLTMLFERIKNEENITADRQIIDLVAEHGADAKFLALDVPWLLPAGLRDGANPKNDEGAHMEWMQDYLRRSNASRKPKRVYTPYVQRCVDAYLSTELEEKFVINQAMSANTAPLLARAMYLSPRLHLSLVEVNPKVSLWRIGRSLGVGRSHLRTHRKAVGGEEARRAITTALISHNVVFVYEQDRRAMIENNHAFESFICALTAFLKFKKKTEPRPDGFPEEEDWVEIPKPEISWKDL